MYNAVILAGGKTPWLQKAVGTNIRALAPLGGRRMVEYIIDALDQSGQIGRIIVAALFGDDGQAAAQLFRRHGATAHEGQQRLLLAGRNQARCLGQTQRRKVR